MESEDLWTKFEESLKTTQSVSFEQVQGIKEEGNIKKFA